jgi:hypothetical protein
MPLPATLPQSRTLICEGYQPDLGPTAVVVIDRTTGKTFVAKGSLLECEALASSYLTEKRNAGGRVDESVAAKPAIVESVTDLPGVALDESKGEWSIPPSTAFVVEGVFQRWGKKNANKRVYTKKLFERLLEAKSSSVTGKLAAREMHGHLEHPSDGKSDLSKAAILTTGLKMEEDGEDSGRVMGRAELLDTPHGRILKTLTLQNVKWGVSSRGNGSVGEDGTVNEDDYELVTFDAVSNPSTPGAHPSPAVSDGKKGRKNESADIADATLSVEDPADALSDAIDDVRTAAVPTDETDASADRIRGFLSAVEEGTSATDDASLVSRARDALAHYATVSAASELDATIDEDGEDTCEVDLSEVFGSDTTVANDDADGNDVDLGTIFESADAVPIDEVRRYRRLANRRYNENVRLREKNRLLERQLADFRKRAEEAESSQREEASRASVAEAAIRDLTSLDDEEDLDTADESGEASDHQDRDGVTSDLTESVHADGGQPVDEDTADETSGRMQTMLLPQGRVFESGPPSQPKVTATTSAAMDDETRHQQAILVSAQLRRRG